MTDKREPKRLKNLLSWFVRDQSSGSGSGRNEIRSEVGSRNENVGSVNNILLESSPSSPLEESPSFPLEDDHNDRIGEQNNIDFTSLQRDPGLRQPIGQYPFKFRDNVQRAYVVLGPYQPYLSSYPSSWNGGQGRRFCHKWFKDWSWVEYYVEVDKAFCFLYFLFDSYPSHHPAFTTDGFNSWKNVNSKKSGLLKHVGALNSPHNACMRQWEVLRNPYKHIESVISTQSTHEKLDNRLRLVAAIESARLLAHQGYAFKGHDESSNSSNGGNFTAVQNAFGRMNLEVKRVLDNAPGNAKEKMAIILRFVDFHEFIRERFFKVIYVGDTCSQTLKNEISKVLAQYDLQVENMRGQGYDGASNMRGATRWGSHFRSISNLIKLFEATQKTLADLVINGLPKIQGEAKSSLQKKAMDILNALRVLSIAKQKLQAMRDNGWDDLILRITSFCCEHNIIVPDLSTPYKKELESRFPDQSLEFLTLSSIFDSHDNFQAFKSEDVCSLDLRFYPMDFSAVSTVTTERAFSSMNILKTILRNRMEDDFFDDLMVLYIEKEFVDSVHNDYVIQEFTKLGPRRVSFGFDFMSLLLYF
ncbi:uncharacterized protein LOC126795753 [Argentina anserina]|uniref:uncharacterized protein LOC126795753 n=1 Tax=Argentina anserina TaxID=57926 RepID=UPI0021766437|nr:uncharacterized protein LOC126795753 [Potentilla anserina]